MWCRGGRHIDNDENSDEKNLCGLIKNDIEQPNKKS